MYSKVSDLPPAFKNMPMEAKKMAMEVMNKGLEDGDDEETAIKKAMGAVKKAYKQDKDGNWMPMDGKMAAQADKLETVDIPDVEILAVGTWRGNKTVTITKEAIPAFVESFDALSSDKNLNYEPPVKLGHDDNQKLLQADGYPAAGWINSLKTKGNKLVASFTQVPKKLGELIKAGAYRKVSAEFYQDYEIGGKKYPWVLKAVSLLGADVPAVKSIQDIQALYSEHNEPEPVIVFAELGEDMSLDKRANMVRDAYYAQNRSPMGMERDCWVSEVFPDHVIMEKGGKMFHVPYTEGADGVSFDLANAVEVKKEVSFVPVKPAAAPAAAASTPNHNTETEVIMESELRKLLKLDEKADVLVAVKALVEKANGTVTLAEHQNTMAELTALKAKLAEGERDKRVTAAIAAGKIIPAQKAWADKYALSDPEGFDAFVAAAPKAVQLGEMGSSGENRAAELTEAERKVARMVGNSEEDLVKEKVGAK